jgi:hypothetical protein
VSFSHQIAIGPEFFQKSKNDYRDWRWALAREFYQNSIDAPGSDQIDITINYWKEPNETTVTVANNGAPMTEEILTGKLLALGSSGKDFGQQGQQAVGGFGKAKEVLYFLHKYYHIRTGKLFCAGSGAGYNLARHEEEFWGTSSTIALPGDQVSEIAEQFKKFARLSQWDGVITLSVSGQKMILSDRLKKGYRRRDLEINGQVWGVVYTNKSAENLLVVRIQGMPMFTKHIEYKDCVLVELQTGTGGSSEVLQSSRDSMKGIYSDSLDKFIADLNINKRQALKDRHSVTRSRTAGHKLAAKWWDGDKPAVKNEPVNPVAKEMAVLVATGSLDKEVAILMASDLATGRDPENVEGWFEAARETYATWLVSNKLPRCWISH